jgi:hypothetical protein
VPTTHPRYTVTDTGELREMLDRAGERWPELGDRRLLLLRLVAAGNDAIAADIERAQGERRRGRQRAAFERAADLIDTRALLDDAAWR